MIWLDWRRGIAAAAAAVIVCVLCRRMALKKFGGLPEISRVFPAGLRAGDGGCAGGAAVCAGRMRRRAEAVANGVFGNTELRKEGSVRHM